MNLYHAQSQLDHYKYHKQEFKAWSIFMGSMTLALISLSLLVTLWALVLCVFSLSGLYFALISHEEASERVSYWDNEVTLWTLDAEFSESSDLL